MTCHEETKSPFKIEDNVLIGEEEKIESNCSNLAELFLNAFDAKPDLIGQVDAETERKVTFRQMKMDSVKCALWLKQKKVEPGDIIVLSTHNHLNTYIPFLASLYIGATTSLWNENISIKNMERALKQSTPKVIFTNIDKAVLVYRQVLLARISTRIVVFDDQIDSKFKLIGEDSKIIARKFYSLSSILATEFKETEMSGFTCTTSEKKISNTVLLMYSSGSTGVPKAVEIPQTMFLCPSVVQSFSVIPGDIVLWFGSLSWITCVALTIRSILSYATAIKCSKFDTDKICKAIEKYKVSWMLIETGLCHQLVKSAAFTKHDMSSLRQVLFTGSTIRRDVHENIGKALPDSAMTAYGMTETGLICYQTGTKKIGSSGFVCKNIHLKIVDLQTKKPLGPNTHGEIYLQCPYMMKGYYKDPEITKSVFDESGWFCTGDIGYYDEDGYIFIVDRVKNLIKYRGHHVSSVDIESLLGSHPAVSDSAVIAVPHQFDGQHPIAFVTKLLDAKVTEEELQELIATNMEDQNKLRGGVVFIEKIPRLVNGKIDRMALREIVKQE